MVDPYGRILEETISLEPTQAVLVQDVPLGTANSVYLLLGDAFGWIALAGFAFFIVFEKKLIAWEGKYSSYF